MWLLGLFLIAAPEPIGITLLEAGEVSKEETRSLLGELGRAIGKVGREPIEVGEGAPSPAVTLELRILGAVRYLRVEIVRRGPGPGDPRAEIDLRKDPELWPVELERLMLQLLGAPAEATPVTASAPGPAPMSVAPWVLGGVGVAALAVGVGFGISSASARRNADLSHITDAEFERWADRTQAHAIVADVSFVVAAVSAVAAAVWWASE